MKTLTATLVDAAGVPIATSVLFRRTEVVVSGARVQSRGTIAGQTDSEGVLRSLSGGVGVALDAGDYRMTWSDGATVSDIRIRIPEGTGTITMADAAAAFDSGVRSQIIAWAEAEQFAPANQEGLLSSVAVTWPDGTPGVFTCLALNTLFGVPDSFAVTYERGGAQFRVVQPTVTRSADGDVVLRPPIIIT